MLRLYRSKLMITLEATEYCRPAGLHSSTLYSSESKALKTQETCFSKTARNLSLSMVSCGTETSRGSLPERVLRSMTSLPSGVKFTRLIKRPLQTSVDRLAAVEDMGMFPQAFEADFARLNVKTRLKCSTHRLVVEDSTAKGVQVQPRDGGPASSWKH
jgi:hypothetical protein